jgi:hypothetical protein
MTVNGIEVCARLRPAATVVKELLDASDAAAALIAIDAPLGWPAGAGEAFTAHRAGDSIPIEADALFRRETDRFVYRLLGQTPLEVGADKIARTALAALSFLGDLRTQLDAA